MKKRKIIFDVDTGSDDALAIMSAVLSPEAFEIVGICSVNGNLPLPNTTENTLRVLELLGAEDIPVIAGAATPLNTGLDCTRNWRKQELETTDENGERVRYHFEYLPLPPAHTKSLPDQHAPIWLINTLLSSEEKITLIMTGPLTDFALAYRIAPEILDHIEEIVIMGGGHDQRNSTGAAEFNIFADPEAAAITLSAGVHVPITLMPLDATHQAYLTTEHAARLRAVGTPICDFAATEVESRVKAYNLMQPLNIPDIAPIHDALCVLYLLDPTIITRQEFLHVDVICGGIADGQTLVDTRKASPDPKNVHFCFSTDAARFSELLCSILERSKK